MSTENKDNMEIVTTSEESRVLVERDPLDVELEAILIQTKDVTPKPSLCLKFIKALGTPKGIVASLAAAALTHFLISNAHFEPLKPGYYLLRSPKSIHRMPHDKAEIIDRLGSGSCIVSDGDASQFGYDSYKGIKGFLKRHWLHLPKQANWQENEFYIKEDDLEFVSSKKPEDCVHYHKYTEKKTETYEDGFLFKKEKTREVSVTKEVEYDTCEIE